MQDSILHSFPCLHGYKCSDPVVHVCIFPAEIITVPPVVESLLLVKNRSKEALFREDKGNCRHTCSYVQREKS